MKQLFLIILSLLMVTSVDAQVSVRRTAKKESTEKTEKKSPRSSSLRSSDKKKADNAKTKSPVSRAGVLSDDGVKEVSTKPAVVQDASQSVAPVKKTTTATKKNAKPVESTVSESTTLRRQLFEATQPTSSPDARWQHVVYRELDLEVDANSALYYPQEPLDGLTNFFQVIFEALIKGELKAYEYLDGREIFSDKYLVDVKALLETHDIAYQTTGEKNGRPTFVVEQPDIPSHLVMSYYIKEKWEVDRTTSQYGPRVLAICPVLHKLGDFGGNTTRYPLFWIDYNDLRPFISSQLIMTSGMNTATRYTIDDYFTLGLYDGEIYKVQNPRGLTLMQQYPDTAQLRQKREEIEAQLKGFGKTIYPKENLEKLESVEDIQTADSVKVIEEKSTKRNRRTKAEAKTTSEKPTKSRSVRR